jgi:membrane-associated phospholipid phosphatase
VLALVGFGVLTLSLGVLEWQDAWFAALMDGLRGCDPAETMNALTETAPRVAAALVAAAVVVALVGGSSPARVLGLLALLGVGILQAQGLKELFERDRPGVAPWVSPDGHALPSGHVVNAALCAVIAVVLVRGVLRPWRPRAVALFALVGGLFVPAVAFTRLYLARHWATDVVASMLLGLAFWGLVSARPTHALRRVLAFVVLVELPSLFIVTAAGGRIPLDSPSRFDGPPPVTSPRPADLLASVGGGTWIPPVRQRSGGYVRLDPQSPGVCVEVGEARPPVLKVLALPLRDPHARGCRWLTALANGSPVGRPLALKPRWRTYAFALPPLPRGANEIRLAIGETGSPDKPALAVRALAVEDRRGRLPVVARGDGAADCGDRRAHEVPRELLSPG